MVGLLGFIGETLEEAGICYEYGEWTQDISYPYFVGSFMETDYRYEDNCTIGTFTLDGWAKGSKINLIEMSDRIKGVFNELYTTQEDSLYYIRFGGSTPVPTGEADLFKVTITLFTYEWKGEQESGISV